MRRAVPSALTAASLAAALAAGVLGAVASPAAALSTDVVISQVYGGGGNSGATLRNDFVELQNRGSAPVSVDGWSVQYTSAAGTTWSGITTLSGTIAPGGYYLVQEAAGGGGTVDLPTPDATGGILMSGTSGKVALVTTSTALVGCQNACSRLSQVKDFVGYGAANDFEGAAPAPTLSNTTAALRGSGKDTDENGADFTAASPAPRNGGTVVPPPPQPAPTDCTTQDTPVGEVQGRTDVSPSAGQVVTVQGAVVGDYEGPTPALRGFYLQDAGDGDDATSDAVFVFEGNADRVANGDVVQVTGTVSEFQGQTQLNASTVLPCDGTGTVAPTEVTLPRTSAGDLERYEGMLVRFPQTLFVTEHFQLGRFGQVVVSSGDRLRQPTALYPAGDPRVAAMQAANDLNRLVVDDASQAQNPDPIVFGRDGAPLAATNTLRGGDTLTGAVGVLTYTWGGNAASPNAFRLRPVGALGGSATFEAANPRPAGVPDVGGTVKVASANLLNFFNTFSGCTFGVGGAAADCRGADDAVEYERQLAKEVAALRSLGADVVGLMEVENDGYGPGSALAALTAALDAQDGPGTWASADPDAATGTVNAAGTDAIKAALLYRADRVTPVAGTTLTDPDPVFERRPVATTFLTRTGARFTVVANHFKSKGSCPTAATDPADVDRGDGQSCWNAKRTEQARELARWVRAEVVPAAGSPDVVLVGDLNAYAQEDPVRVLAAAGYTDLAPSFQGPDAYSYVFDGQWGALDHVMTSESLTAKATGADDVHINADEPSVLDYDTAFKSAAQVASLYSPDRFRTSDHDPVLAGFDLRGATTTTVASSAPDALYRGEVRWTATVASAGADAPSGTVQFTVDGVPFGDPVPLVDGRATSPATSSLTPGGHTVEAVYSGSAGNAASTATFEQAVRFAVIVTRPAPGATAKAGSTVQVRVALRDALGAVPDAVARQWVGGCRVTVAVSGVQTVAPFCAAEYDPADRVVEARWKSAPRPTGTVTVTASVTYPGLAAPSTATATLALR